jgi:hypothetical protein
MPGLVMGVMTGGLLGPGGLNVSGMLGDAMGSSLAGNVATGALKSAIMGGDPLMGALGAGITPGLSSLGVPDSVAPALGGAIKAGISGGDPLMAALTSGAGAFANSFNPTDSPVYDTTADTDMTGFKTDPGEINWGPVDAPDIGGSIFDAPQNNGFVLDGQTVDLGNSNSLTGGNMAGFFDDLIGLDSTSGDADMTGFYTPNEPAPWEVPAADSTGWFDGTDNSGMGGDGGVLADSIFDTGGDNDYISRLLGGTVNLGNSAELMPTSSGALSGIDPTKLAAYIKSLLGGTTAAGGTTSPGVKPSLGNNILGQITGDPMSAAFNASPFLLALYEANRQGGDIDSTLLKLQGLVDGVDGNGIRNAVLNPYDQQTATGLGSLTQSLGSRGVMGSSFGNADITNYNTTRDMGRGDLLAKTDLAVTGTKSDLFSKILQGQTQKNTNRNLLLGAGLSASGKMFQTESDPFDLKRLLGAA